MRCWSNIHPPLCQRLRLLLTRNFDATQDVIPLIRAVYVHIAARCGLWYQPVVCKRWVFGLLQHICSYDLLVLVLKRAHLSCDAINALRWRIELWRAGASAVQSLRELFYRQPWPGTSKHLIQKMDCLLSAAPQIKAPFNIILGHWLMSLAEAPFRQLLWHWHRQHPGLRSRRFQHGRCSNRATTPETLLDTTFWGPATHILLRGCNRRAIHIKFSKTFQWIIMDFVGFYHRFWTIFGYFWVRLVATASLCLVSPPSPVSPAPFLSSWDTASRATRCRPWRRRASASRADLTEAATGDSNWPTSRTIGGEGHKRT